MRHRDRQNIGEKYLQLDSDITIGSLGDNHHYYEKYGHTTKEKNTLFGRCNTSCLPQQPMNVLNTFTHFVALKVVCKEM